LGAVLYALLVGAPPAGGEAALSALDQGGLQVPPAWRNTIAASLQKAAEARPLTASEFLRNLKDTSAAPVTIPAPKELPADIPPPVQVPVETPAPTPAPEAAPVVETKSEAPVERERSKSKRAIKSTERPA